jgi:hypothetical protein
LSSRESATSWRIIRIFLIIFIYVRNLVHENNQLVVSKEIEQDKVNLQKKNLESIVFPPDLERNKKIHNRCEEGRKRKEFK